MALLGYNLQCTNKKMLVGTVFKEKSNTVAFQLPDPSTPFGERVARRLREDRLIWFTTVDAKGTPQPTPVWFLWDEENSTLLIYSRADAKRLQHLQHNSRVALNFDGNGTGGNIIVITGEAHVSNDDPPADRLPAYAEKYREFIARRYETPEKFAVIYPVTLRIRPTAIRGH